MLLAGKGMRRVLYGSLKPIAFINVLEGSGVCGLHCLMQKAGVTGRVCHQLYLNKNRLYCSVINIVDLHTAT